MRRGHRIAIPLLIVVGAAIASCGGGHPTRVQAIDPDDALAPLVRLERRFDRRPSAVAMEAQPPPGFGTEMIVAVEPRADAQATMPLHEVLAQPRYASLPEAVSGDEPGAELDADDKDEAVRSYVLGRARRLGGDVQGAETELRRAVSLDPQAAPAWRELAETMLVLGNRPGATNAFRRALLGGASDHRALEYLSGEALERQEYDNAIAYLNALRRTDPGQFDPALPAIVSARLGTALIARGYLTAGREALADALELPIQFGQTTNYARELAGVYRRRASMWIEIGDAALRQGLLELAFQAYEEARSIPGGDAQGLLARRVLAEMQRGNPAAAARAVLESLRDLERGVDRDAMKLLGFINANSDIGPVIGRVVSALAQEQSSRPGSAAARALVLAGAAVADAPDAIEMIRRWIARAPADDAAIRQLMTRASALGLGQVIEQTALLVEQTPLELERYVGAMTAGGRVPASILDAYGSELAALTESEQIDSMRPSHTLMQARLLMMLARIDKAVPLLEPMADSPDDEIEAVAAGLLVRALSLQARWDEADELASRLASEDSLYARLGGALGLSAIDREWEALALLDGLEEEWSSSGQPPIRDLDLLRAQLQLALGRFDQAWDILQRMVGLDPWQEEGYILLLQLGTQIQGPRNPERAQEIAARILELDADSPTRRWLEASRQSQTQRALSALDSARSIEEDYPGRPYVLGLLVQLAASLRSQATIEWIGQRSAERPGEPGYAYNVARLMRQLERDRSAFETLDQAWERTPGDRLVSTEYEQLLRVGGSHLRDRREEVIRTRLNRKFQTPLVQLDRAERAMEENDFETTVMLIEAIFAQARPISGEALRRAEKVLLRLEEPIARGQISADVGLRLHDAIVRRNTDLSPEFHGAGLRLQVDAGAPLDALLTKLRLVAERYPDRALEMFVRTGERLVRRAGAARVPEQDKLRARESLSPVYRLGLSKLPDPQVSILRGWLLQSYNLANSTGFRQSLQESLRTCIDREIYDEVMRGFVRLNDPEAAQNQTLMQHAARFTRFVDPEDDPELLEYLYREMLRHDPKNLNANNNLGYQFLLWGRNLEEAERMIQIAYDVAAGILADEQRAFVTDSLGWARYKLGIIHDELNEDGTIRREGAVRVLERALARAELDSQNPSRIEQKQVLPVLHDHLGDAYWAADRRELAIEHWGEAVSIAERNEADEQLRQVVTQLSGDVDRVFREMRESAGASRSKLQAAIADREPSVSRIHRPVNRQPRATEAGPVK